MVQLSVIEQKLNGLNYIGLKRKNIDKVEINAMRKLYKNIFEKLVHP